ncbi:MAG: glycosyltransferase [Planctomycetia bacterium]|nr:glycosyltransferase [Planctomycetia bacterium]
MQPAPLHRIAFVGTYPPRRCGIATYTRDLRDAIAATLVHTECLVVPVVDADGGDHPPEVRFTIRDDSLPAYRRAAEYLNLCNVDVVSLQHEYGIFGGPAGAHVLALVRGLRMPVHTTLHTVLAEPTAEQLEVMEELLARSSRVAVMTERGRRLLGDRYRVDDARIDVIPHGIPEMPFESPAVARRRLGIEAGWMLLTFGLLAPNKGIEHVIAALPAILAEHPDGLYVVLGATHPHLVRREGEAYRERLAARAADLGVQDRVLFLDRYVELPELLAFIAAADVYVTPYLNQDQITSGTLAYAFGCGKPVISTPYWHAAELLADGRGVIVPFRDPGAIARETNGLLADDGRRLALARRAWQAGRGMTWSRVAERYVAALGLTRQGAVRAARRVEIAGPTSAASVPRFLPAINLDHLRRLTDSCGIIQHATYDVPNLDEGYCTDDNARALTLAVTLEDLGVINPWLDRAAAIYAAFLGHAFDRRTGRFRNLLGFDHRWRDERGSDDCLGRAIVALGTCVGRSRRTGLRRWAAEFLPVAIRAVAETTSPRAWALAVIGIDRYLERFGGDRFATAIRDGLGVRLLTLRQSVADHDWPWFEDILTYENARPCEALIVLGKSGGYAEAGQTGLGMLRWLDGVQRSPGGCFRPIGCRGFYPRGGEPAAFDQQPIEAEATVSAALAAWRVSGQREWLDAAWRAYGWFHGHNELGIRVYEPIRGGCRDGLLEDRVNENQGAESTLAHLQALVELALAAGRDPGQPSPATVEGGCGARPTRTRLASP